MADVTQSNEAFIAALRALLAGMATTLPANVTQIVAEGEVSTTTDITTELNSYITVYQAAEDAAVALHNAVVAREAIAPKATARYAALRSAVKSMIGKKSPNLTKVGITPDKCESRNLELRIPRETPGASGASFAGSPTTPPIPAAWAWGTAHVCPGADSPIAA